MTSATQSPSDAPAFSVERRDDVFETFDAGPANPPPSRWSFARFGLETRDVLIVMLGVLLVVAYGPFFWLPNWTPRALLLLAALPFGMYDLARLARGRDPAALVALVLTCWAVVTSLLSDAPWVSLLPAMERHEGAWVMAGALGCWALARTLTQAGRRALGLALLAACAANGIIGVLQVVLDIEKGPLAAIDQRATGLSTNPVYFGAIMAGVVAGCAWTFGSRARSRYATVALIGVGLGSFLVTMSGSRVALAAQLVFVAAVIVKHHTLRSLLVLSSAAVGSVLGTTLQRGAGGSASSATDRIGGGGLGDRLVVWKYGWQAFLDRPLFGYGLGRYRPAVQRFFDAEFVRSHQRDDLLEAWFESHNIVVQMTVAMGLVGVVLLIAFVTLSLRHARGPLLWAAGAITVTWLLQPARLVTFPLVAVLLGASQPRLRSVAAEGRHFVGRALGSVGAATSIVIVGWVVVADHQIQVATSNPSLAASARAVRWSPWDPFAANEAATMVLDPDGKDPRVTRQVLEWSSKAAELEPDFPYWWMRLGIRQMVLEDVELARPSFERALDLQPYHPISLQMLRAIANRQNDPELLRLVNGRLEELGLSLETDPSTAGG